MVASSNMASIDSVTQDTLTRAKAIKLVIFDVDGVMTDGGLTIGDDGQEYKTFNTQDGLGMKLLKASGVQMAIITGRTSNVVKQRSESTGVAHVYRLHLDKNALHQYFQSAVSPHLRCGQ